MKRWIRKTVLSLSITSAVGLAAGGVALAQQGKERGGHGHHAGLLDEALQLDSLSAEQRAAIGQLVDQRRSASIPVRQADAQVLTALAQEVEQATIDRQTLAPALSAEESAVGAKSVVERDALNRLHTLLTPAQRSDLVARIEAERAHEGAHADREERSPWGRKLGLTPGQKSQIATNLRAGSQGSTPAGVQGFRHGANRQALESFSGDSFDAAALVNVRHPGERAEKLAEAMLPVLTPAQRAEFAKTLRARATRESHS